VATHDYVIANGTGAAVRSDLNGALAAIVSQNSNASAPATTYAYMSWADTTAGVMKMRNGANSAWISLYELDGTFLASDISLAAGSAAAPSLFFTGDTNTGLFSPGADTVALATAGQNRLHVSSGGLVGIGTTGPTQPLHVIGAAQQALFEGSTQGAIEIKRSANNGYVIGSDTSGVLYFYDQNSSTTRLRIDSSGRLLVGTSSARTGFFNGAPVSPQLQAEGLSGSGSTVALIDNENGTTGGGVIIGRSRGTSLGSVTILQSGDSIGSVSYQGADGTDFVEAARIEAVIDGTPGANDMPGRLVFSTTADGASSPTERMRINSSGFTNLFVTAADGFQSRNSSAAGTSLAVFAGRYSATSTTDGLLSFIVWTNGNVVNTNNSYGAISDIKLKENIVDANSQWDDLKALQVRNYNFKEGQTHTQIGLVAQEVELVSPGLVSESPDRDEEGNDLGTVTKAVNYSVLYMKAVKALQEAMERIEALEADVAALKGA